MLFLRRDRGAIKSVKALTSPEAAPIQVNVNECEQSNEAVKDQALKSGNKGPASWMVKMKMRIRRLLLRLLRKEKSGKKEMQEINQNIIKELKHDAPVDEILPEICDAVLEYHENEVQMEYLNLIEQLDENTKVEDVEISEEMLKSMDAYFECCKYEKEGLEYPQYLQIPAISEVVIENSEKDLEHNEGEKEDASDKVQITKEANVVAMDDRNVLPIDNFVEEEGRTEVKDLKSFSVGSLVPIAELFSNQCEVARLILTFQIMGIDL